MSDTKNVKKGSCNTPTQATGFGLLWIVGIVVIVFGAVIIGLFQGSFTSGSGEWMLVVYGGGVIVAIGVVMTIYGLARRFCWF